MKKSVLYTIVALIVIFVPVFAWKWFVQNKMHQMMAARTRGFAATISVAPAREQPWVRHLHSVGSVTAVNGIELAPQLPGTITSLTFHSGEYVKQGQRLLVINGAVVLRAPFSGHLGIRQVSLGQYVAPGTRIVSLQVWNPVHVDFTLPQSALPLIALHQQVEFGVDAYPGRPFTGQVSALGAGIDAASRTIAIRATLKNPHMALRPGMFGTVTLSVGAPVNALTVPATALTYSTFGAYVYVVHQVTHDGHSMQVVKRSPVQVGLTRDGLVQITQGLAAGDLVVTAGQVKLREGMPVRIVPQAGPGDSTP